MLASFNKKIKLCLLWNYSMLHHFIKIVIIKGMAKIQGSTRLIGGYNPLEGVVKVISVIVIFIAMVIKGPVWDACPISNTRYPNIPSKFTIENYEVLFNNKF